MGLWKLEERPMPCLDYSIDAALSLTALLDNKEYKGLEKEKCKFLEMI